jgi:hypothetical protein
MNSTFTVPASPAGPATITFDTGNSDVVAAAPFTVTPFVSMSPTNGPPGTPVTVQITGFLSSRQVTAQFGVAALTAGVFTDLSGSGDFNFVVPPGTTDQVITVTVQAGVTASALFTVDGAISPDIPNANAPVTVSPLANYQVGIDDVQYWNGTGFGGTQSSCRNDTLRSDQLQRLTVTASAPGANDQLSLVVADPRFLTPPSIVTVTASPSPATAGNTLVFTAQVQPSGVPPPTGDITWSGDCTGSSKLGTGPLTCAVTNAAAGPYFVTATYSGDGNYAPSSGSASIFVHPVTKLMFTTAPANTQTNGAAWSPQPTVVTIQDDEGDTATSDTDNIQLSITQPAGTTATLSCAPNNPLPPNTVAAANGVATFTGCQITGPADNYTITATDTTTNLTADTANITLVPGSPTKVHFTTPPTNTQTNGTPWNPQPTIVAIQDSGGNTVPGALENIHLRISGQPAGNTATLTCDTPSNTVAAVNGAATFTGCQIVGPTGPYTITATDTTNPALTIDTAINLRVGQPARVAFTTPPGNSQASGRPWSPQPTIVAIQDSGGNTITNDSDTIGLTISQPTGTPATLTCDAPGNIVTAVTSIATFTGCQITGPLGAYTISATDITTPALSADTAHITLSG